MSLLATRGVSRRFGSLMAVDCVDLAVEAGEVVGLLGANGAGKTTLLRLALGLLLPTDGDVTLFDAPPSRQTRFRLGYVPQSLGLYEDLTVDENRAFAARAFRGAGAPRVATVASVMVTGAAVESPVEADAATRSPDVTDAAVRAAGSTLVRDLPLGLRRRVAFATAIDHAPDLLVLDEPTSGVDPLARARLWEMIRAAADGGSGVLVTTHHMAEAEQCDRLVVMVAGRVAVAGTADAIVGGMTAVEITAQPWEAAHDAVADAGLPLVLVGRTVRTPGADVDHVRGLLGARGVAASLRVVPATFEEAFVALSMAGSAAG